jgi:F-type H+-transporting ATPase subunit delta
VAEKDGSLDRVEDELFRFGRVLDREPELRGLLSDTATPVDKRLGLLRDVLGEKVTRSPRHCSNRRCATPQPQLDVAAEGCPSSPRRAATATSHTSAPPSDDRRAGAAAHRLPDPALRQADLPQVELDPDLLGGLVVRVGGELIDGSVAGRLAAARRALPS